MGPRCLVSGGLGVRARSYHTGIVIASAVNMAEVRTAETCIHRIKPSPLCMVWPRISTVFLTLLTPLQVYIAAPPPPRTHTQLNSIRLRKLWPTASCDPPEASASGSSRHTVTRESPGEGSLARPAKSSAAATSTRSEQASALNLGSKKP